MGQHIHRQRNQLDILGHDDDQAEGFHELIEQRQQRHIKQADKVANAAAGVHRFGAAQQNAARRSPKVCVFVALCNYLCCVNEIKLFSLISRMMPGTSSKRHHQQQPPLPQKNVVPPPLPAKNLSQPAPIAASGPSPVDTFVVYSYCDEELPYRIKVPSSKPLTLKLFKENMPKKGNYRCVRRHKLKSRILWKISFILQIFLQNHLWRWRKPNHPGRNQQRLRCAATVRGQNHGDPQIGQLKPRPAPGTWVLTY